MDTNIITVRPYAVMFLNTIKRLLEKEEFVSKIV